MTRRSNRERRELHASSFTDIEALQCVPRMSEMSLKPAQVANYLFPAGTAMPAIFRLTAPSCERLVK
jgi:hypothetical protein